MPLSVLTKGDFTPRTADQAAKRFARKAALTSDAFDRLSDDAKGHAFRVTGVHNANLIQHARNIVHRGIKKGEPFRDVYHRLIEAFDTKGVPPVSLPRLRMAFTQNGQQAYNDARRDTLDEPGMAKTFPFRQYLTVGNGKPGFRNVRPEHAALHGLVFTWNDPFWDSHTPPWGYNCRCTFRPLTAGQAKRLGARVRTGGWVRSKIRVAGRGGLGIKPDRRFKRGGFDLSRIDDELRKAVRKMLG